MRNLIAMALAAALLSGSWAVPALAMGDIAEVPEGTQAVPQTTATSADGYNACVSRVYSGLKNRSATINEAMGRYRDNFGVAKRAVKARNLPVFNDSMRKALPDAAIVAGTRCTYGG